MVMATTATVSHATARRGVAQGAAAGSVWARPIPVAAYPAGTPRWVTYEGRRRRVLAVESVTPPPHPNRAAAVGVRRLRVELAGGSVITLVHRTGAWYGAD